MKQLVAMLLALLLLFSGAVMADEDLNAIVPRLEEYLDDLTDSKGNGVDATKLEECVKFLEETKSRNKKSLELYCSVLLSIEKNQFTNANGDMFVLRRESMAKSFEENFVKSAGGDTSISTVEELYNYLKGREAEYGGKREEAIEFYDKCLDKFDTYYREENIKLEWYDSAMNLYRKGEYEQARSMLEKLAQMEYPEAVRELVDFVTPTPTPTPTPKPTSTPSPKPTPTPTPKPTRKPTPTPSPTPVGPVVGTYIEFGSYPQTAAGNDDTPIEWLVLENDGETALLISRYELDCQPYNTVYESTTWEQCTLRSWLNNSFYRRAFNAEERNCIVKSSVSADKTPWFSTDPGNATEDNVFLLSMAEADKYFDGTEIRMCAATDYAIQKAEYLTIVFDSEPSCGWWVRSPGCDSADAAIVYIVGYSRDSLNVNDGGGAVRPCVRVRLADISQYTRDDSARPSESTNRSSGQVYSVGEYVTIGTYPQTAAGNDDTPIEWLVLENDGETALLISRYALDCRQYNTVYESTTWEQCTLRSWLNDEFYNRAFDTKERKRIVKSNVSADENPAYSTNPGNATKDNVFLLSVVEAEKYFKSGEARRCAATDYAIQSGAYEDNGFKANDRWACWWWLRSPGLNSDFAAHVHTDGSIYYNIVYYSYIAVRPCVRVRLF